MLFRSFFCPHTPEEHCDCRKPLPGLMLQVGERYGLNLKDVAVVGDSLRDLLAGVAAGCPTHLLRTGKAAQYSEEQLAHVLAQAPGTQVHADLAAFADAFILRERRLRGLTGESDSGYGRLN